MQCSPYHSRSHASSLYPGCFSMWSEQAVLLSGGHSPRWPLTPWRWIPGNRQQHPHWLSQSLLSTPMENNSHHLAYHPSIHIVVFFICGWIEREKQFYKNISKKFTNAVETVRLLFSPSFKSLKTDFCCTCTLFNSKLILRLSLKSCLKNILN